MGNVTIHLKCYITYFFLLEIVNGPVKDGPDTYIRLIKTKFLFG